jgi:hypothetical protein
MENEIGSHGQLRNVYNILVGKPPLRRPRRKGKDMQTTEVDSTGAVDSLSSFLNMAMTFGFHKNVFFEAVFFFTSSSSCAQIVFSNSFLV